VCVCARTCVRVYMSFGLQKNLPEAISSSDPVVTTADDSLSSSGTAPPDQAEGSSTGHVVKFVVLMPLTKSTFTEDRKSKFRQVRRA
jgi:hypothetical protein